jgi:hypothetical protein
MIIIPLSGMRPNDGLMFQKMVQHTFLLIGKLAKHPLLYDFPLINHNHWIRMPYG